jgi:hypothetical protein
MPEDTSSPKVSVHGIKKEDYDTGLAGGDGAAAEPGLKGHLKKYGMLYLVLIGAATIVVIIMFRNNNQSGDTSGATDPYGYGTGNSSASDTYGAQLDSDYQMMQNAMNQNNTLLASLLAGKTKTSKSSGSSHHKKKVSSGGTTSGHKKKITTSKPGGSTGGSSKGHSGHMSKGHAVSTKGHSTATHSSGKTSVSKHSTHTSTGAKPNPHAGGAHGWTYTAKGGETLANLQKQAWPGNIGKNPAFINNYANNRKLLRSELGSKYGLNTVLKKGQKVIL